MATFTSTYWYRWLQTHLVWLVPVALTFAIYAVGQLQAHQTINWDLLWTAVLGAIGAQLRLLATKHDLRSGPLD